MLTTTLRTTAFAAAVLACAGTATTTRAQETSAALPSIDQAELLKNINVMNNDTQDKFVLDLASKADTDLGMRFAKIDNDFFATTTPVDVKAVEANVATATANSLSVFSSLVIADAELGMNAKVANIENPFERHLPMAPFMMAFTIHQ